MNRVAAAIRPLSTEMEKVSAGFKAFPIRIQKLISSNAGLVDSNTTAGKSFSLLGNGATSSLAKIGIWSISLYQITSAVKSWITQSNDYIENMNLFSVAMGDAAQSAYRYAETVNRALGVDPSEWIRNQGVFKQITSGFGVTEANANQMSKVLTQLGYDISSFFNITTEDAMLKLQSGISGELEPLRRLGYALDQATLQQVAYNHGINESITAMTQAEKSYLRFIAIYEQSSNVMGDLSRTVQTPANAIRILSQQITQLKRSLGNLLLPILQQVIPWVQAFVVVITDAIQALANFFGFELPTIDYSGMDNIAVSAGGAADAVEDTAGALGDAASAAKKLKDYTLGFDELNILRPDTDTAGGSSGGGSAGIGGIDSGLDLSGYDYDFLGDVKSNLDDIKRKVQDFLPLLATIGGLIAAWKISEGVMQLIDFLKALSKNKAKRITLGLGVAITGFTLEFSGAYDIGYNGLNLTNGIQTLVGAALGIAGSLITFGTGPLGWTIGITAALVIGITGFTLGYNRRKIDDELKKRFGEITLSVEEAKEYAERIMSSPLSIQLDTYIEVKNSAKEAVENYLNSSQNFSYLVWKAQIGLDVDYEDLTASVDAMVSEAQTFLDSQQEAFTMAVSLSFSDENIKSDMAQFVAKYFADSSTDMTRLGEELKEEMLNALADGKLDPKELETIANLQSEMNQIMEKVADAEYKAQLTNAVYELDGELSFDSVKRVQEELEPIVQEQFDSLEEIHLDALAAIELKYKSDGNYDEYVQAIEDELKTYNANKAQISTDAFLPLMNKINTAFSDAVSGAQEAFNIPVENLFTNTFKQFDTDETGYLVDGTIKDFVLSAQTSFQNAFGAVDLTPEAKAALQEVLDALSPSMEQQEQLLTDCINAGQKVPDGLSQGLHDYYSLAAINGDLDAINYLIGEKLSTDPNFLDALQKAEDAGLNVNEALGRGLLANTEVEKNADGTVTLVNDTIGEKVIEITPELEELFEKLGIDLSSSLYDGADGQLNQDQRNWENLGSGIPSNVYSGADSQLETDNWKWEQLGRDAVNGFSTGAFGIALNVGAQIGQQILAGAKGPNGLDSHSPSKAFEKLGLDSIAGYERGVSGIYKIGEELGIKALSGFSVRNFIMGGFPTPGQLFIANEPGNPEMVGSIGGRTAVANTSQITQGIAQAVYQAFVAAQNTENQQPIDITVTVPLDGRTVYRNQERVRQGMGYRMTTSTIPV